MEKPQRDFRFRFQPVESHPDDVLLGYLKKQGRVANDLLLRAVRAFWLPLAYQNSKKKQGQDLKLLAQNMVFVLEEQANFLRVTFDLAKPVSSYSYQPVVEAKVQQELEVEDEPWIALAAQEFDSGGL